MESTTAAVSLKLPVFWSTQPKSWFCQAEAQFAIRKISEDETKYYYVIAALDSEVAGRISSFLENPPEKEKYASIKAFLIKLFSVSSFERATRILNIGELGDRKPSLLMNEMLNLAGGETIGFLFHQIFLEKLPGVVRSQLVNEDFTDLRKVADKADVLYEIYKDQNNSFSVNKVNFKNTSDKVNVKNTSDTLCFYHKRFAEKAKKCIPPCSFQGNDQTGRQ